ncbi:MAG: hypothetical protein LBM25_06005 [Bacteroidales bacterium]|jgi:hypothetical protein|nr:hypothetical protein [Bacteroidales bacterium]
MKRIIFILILLIQQSVFGQIITNNINCLISDISEDYYLSHNDVGIRLDTNNKLKKENNSYNIKLNNNKNIILTDSNSEDNPSYVKYLYIGRFNNYLCFEVYYYEISKILLINDYNGEKIEIIGNIYISPDMKYLINASQIMEYDQMPNIIQIWLMDNYKLNLITNINLEDNWIPENIKWIDNNTILFQKLHYNNTKSWEKISINNISE